jgi:hypothetical protein
MCKYTEVENAKMQFVSGEPERSVVYPGYVLLVLPILRGGKFKSRPQSAYRGRVKNRSALSAGAYTTTLDLVVDIVKGVGVHPHPNQAVLIFPS